MTIKQKISTIKRRLELALLRYHLPRILSRKSGPTIPRSGLEGRRVNSFTLYWYNNDTPRYLVEGYNAESQQLTVMPYNEERKTYEGNQTIPLENQNPATLKIWHYYGLFDITYFGIWSYTLSYFTKYNYVVLLLYRVKESILQSIFNKKKFKSINRIELLRLIVEEKFSPDINPREGWIGEMTDGFYKHKLMNRLHSRRWMSHPFGWGESKKLGVYLDSLVKTGELQKNRDQYFVTAKALETLEQYDENARRHKDAHKIQSRIAWLTTFLVIISILTLYMEYVKLTPMGKNNFLYPLTLLLRNF